MNKLKIAILHPQAKIKWWAIKMLFLIANELKNDNKVDFFVFDFDKEKCFIELNKDLNIVNLNLYWFKKIFWLIRLSFYLRKYDLILAWNSPTHFVAVLAKFFKKFSSKKNLKVFWYLQNIPFYYLDGNRSFFTSIKRFLEKIIIVPNLEIIANSKFISDKVKEFYKKDSFLLYPCVDTDFFVKDSKDQSFWLSLFVNSRLVKWKNVELAINTFFKLKDSFPDLKLFIAWDWEERGRLEDMCREWLHHSVLHHSGMMQSFLTDLQNHIIFLWEISQDEVKKYYEISTVFLFTSLIDAFWLTIIEAMSMEKPIVALNNWWPAEIISSWINWYLADDENNFFEKVKFLLENELLRRQIWLNASDFVRNKFSRNNLWKMLNEIFFS